MALIRRNPMTDISLWNPDFPLTSDFTNIRNQVDRLFNQFLGGYGTEGRFQATYVPPVDIIERDDAYLVRAEVPGMRQEDIKISIANNVLTIRGQKLEEEEEQEDRGYVHYERMAGAFQRQFTLPTIIRTDEVEASYDNGILTINLPKAEESRPREVEVRAGTLTEGRGAGAAGGRQGGRTRGQNVAGMAGGGREIPVNREEYEMEEGTQREGAQRGVRARQGQQAAGGARTIGKGVGGSRQQSRRGR